MARTVRLIESGLGELQGRQPRARRKDTVMGLGDKFSNAADVTKGKVKELVGKVTGDRRLENEGKAVQAKAKLKKATQKIKNTVKDALD